MRPLVEIGWRVNPDTNLPHFHNGRWVRAGRLAISVNPNILVLVPAPRQALYAA
jgi:hypothetical protein